MIRKVSLHNFMGYRSFEPSAFGAVNIIIGRNDTGKTGLMKLLYAILKSMEIYSLQSVQRDASIKRLLAEKLQDTFQTGKRGLGELVTKGQKEKLSVEVTLNHGKTNFNDRVLFTFGEATTNTIVDMHDEVNRLDSSVKTLFIPAKEVLTALKAIRATRDNLHIQGFDDTYIDLIKALVVPISKGNIAGPFKQVNQCMEDLLHGRIEQGNDDDFIFKKGNSEYSMQLTAEGIKKIGVLSTLIKNRQLTQNSVLFLDEPETALHPEAIRELMNMCMLLAEGGVQIFIATHNYFVLKQAYLACRKQNVPTNCYQLARNEQGEITCTSSLLNEVFPANSLTDEQIEMADEETMLDLNL